MKKAGILISFAVLAAIMLLLYPREGKFQYDYQKGRPWVYETLIAPIDFPILKTEAEMLEEKEAKASENLDFYTYDESVASAAVGSFSKDAIKAGADGDFVNFAASSLGTLYNGGLVSSFGDEELSDKVIIVKRGKRVTETPALNVYDIASAYNVLKTDLAYEFPGIDVDSVVQALNLKEYLLPNLLYDENTTRLVHREAVNYISPTKGVVYAGQLIVSKGEIVTAEIAQLLDSYKAEYNISFGYSGSSLSFWVSRALICIAVVLLIFFSILFYGREVLSDWRMLLYLISLALITFIAIAVLYRVDQKLLFLFPFAAMVLFNSAFFKDSLVWPVYLTTLLPLLIIPESGMELYVINVASGGMAMLSYRRFNRGWLQFVNIAILFVTMVLVWLAFNMLSGDTTFSFRNREIAFLGINALLVIVLYPFTFLFEKLFSFVSYTRLWELSDTNNRLLQDLQYKAPGTFQHSLQTANLAEKAASEIGANAMLVRVGALYHDIGKMENPVCFVENNAEGVDYHAGLTPEESAKAIIKHVDDGVALARKYGLPQIVTDFITTHHGRSMTLYFYNVWCNGGGDPEAKAPFTYHGELPATKEQVILMMADAVEAASRTLKSYSEESISNLVDKILSSKLDDEQMAQADISIKEIGIVKQSFKTYLQQIYHARIAYPSRKKQ